MATEQPPFHRPSSEYTYSPSVYEEPWDADRPMEPLILTGALSSLIPPSLSPPNDQGQYQDFLHRMAGFLNLPAEDVQDPQDKFLDIVQPAGPSHTVLPIHNALLEPAQAVCHTLTSCTSTHK